MFKSKKKIIAVITSALIIMGCIFIGTHYTKGNIYTEALALYSDGKLNEADEKFKSLKSYKKSEQYLAKIDLLQATEMVEKEDYLSATTILELIDEKNLDKNELVEKNTLCAFHYMDKVCLNTD